MNKPFEPVKKRPAYMLVFEAIEEGILSGQLQEGDLLPTEMELCEQFSVQRSTVREGIRLLEQTGLVRRESGRRLAVSRPKSDEAAARASQNLERHGVEFDDIWQAIRLFFPVTAKLAAETATDEKVAGLEEITSNLENAQTAEDVVRYGIDYLQALAEVADNKVISVTLQSLNLLTKSSLEAIINDLPQARRRIMKAQTEMTEALRSHDGLRAQEWMQRHIDDLRRGYEVAQTV